MTHDTASQERKNKHVIAVIIVVFIVLALALMQSIVGATADFTTRKDSAKTVASSASSSSVANVPSSASSTSVTVLAEPAARVAGFFSGATSKPAAVSSSAKAVTPTTILLKPVTAAQTIRSFFSIVGKPKEGQVLMYKNGRLEWQSLDYVAGIQNTSDASIHISGRGRKPTYPINARELLHSAAGSVSPERHYAGGGSRGGNNSSAGTTTVNNTYTTIVSGSGSGAATFIGTTPVTTYNGQFTSGLKTGYDAGNALCDAAFTGSHMCRTEEILHTIATEDISTIFSGIADAWIAEGPPGFTADSNDCRGWTSSNLAHLGPWWDFDASSGGIGYLTNCSTVKPIACCKVQ